MQNFRDTCTNVLRVSHDSCATVLRKHAKISQQSGGKIKLSDIRTNVVRHSHECCATVVRIKMKISYTEQKKKRNNRPPRIFEFKGKTLIILDLLLYDSHLWDIRVYRAKN